MERAVTWGEVNIGDGESEGRAPTADDDEGELQVVQV